MSPDDGHVLDDALVTRFDAPRSYTGEPMVEIACHGGVASPTAILDLLIARGARVAEPGEFTRRAVLNGKLDLLQAEGVLELVDAHTSAHREVALAQVHGGLSRLVQGLRRELIQLEAMLAYDVDFPEEDDGPIPRERVTEVTTRVLGRLRHLAATAPLAGVARDGAIVVIAGAPNAGKSSLFNAFLGEERAIVTELPGTTRDAIEARVERSPWPLRLVDTAGLRSTDDRLERLGIEVSERHIRAAHVVLACGETRERVREVEEAVRVLTDAAIVGVRTKADMAPQPETGDGVVVVSAFDRTGLDTLLLQIDGVLAARLGSLPVDGQLLTRARQRQAVEGAASELQAFLDAWRSESLPATISSVHVRSATQLLDELIGRVDVEDVLDELFRAFCVGK